MTFSEEEFTRRRIVAICERALREADVAGSFPTALERLEPVAGIDETLDIGELPDDPDFSPPRALGRILGALHYRSRVAFVDRSQIEGRVRWTVGHETTHSLIPWHRTIVLFDNEERLFRATEEKREWEANIGAAHLIFQGARFFERALSYEESIKTPILLAADFGASMHATIWYYAEHHPEPIALAVAGRHTRSSGHVPIFSTVESPSFRERFGPFGSHLPAEGLPLVDGLGNDALAEAARQAKLSIDEVETDLQLTDRGGNQVPVRGELFFNQRSLFLAVAPKKLVRLGRRVRLASRSSSHPTAFEYGTHGPSPSSS